MDPNEALKQLRELIKEAREFGEIDEAPFGDGTSLIADLIEQFEAMDEWLTRGGFLPRAWAAKR